MAPWKFHDACSGAPKTTPVLLVDAEGPVDWGRGSAREHLQRVNHWDLRFTDDRSVHLMVQSMETWIIPDAETVPAYYGKGFRKKALPAATDPEQVEKSRVLAALKQATAATPRRRYDKTRDAPTLLERLDSRRVAARCRAAAPGCSPPSTRRRDTPFRKRGAATEAGRATAPACAWPCHFSLRRRHRRTESGRSAVLAVRR